MRTNAGTDLQARVLGGDVAGDTGTATGTSATTLTDSGKSWTVNAFKGHVVAIAGVYGVIVSNTATALTVDKWNAPATPGGAAGTTPGNVGYVILPGGQPAFWLALSTDATVVAATDTSLTSELTGFGLQRAVATYAHTAAATSYTLSKTFTSTDATTRTINKVGVLNAAVGGDLAFSSLVTSPPPIATGDVITITETVNL